MRPLCAAFQFLGPKCPLKDKAMWNVRLSGRPTSKSPGSEYQPDQLLDQWFWTNHFTSLKPSFNSHLSSEGFWASWGCHNKLPQARWLKQQMYFLTVLQFWEQEVLNKRCWQGWFLVEALRENPFHSSLAVRDDWQSLMFLGLLLHYSNPASIFTRPFTLCFSFSVSYKDTVPWIQSPP